MRASLSQGCFPGGCKYYIVYDHQLNDHRCAADNRQVHLAYAVNYAEQGLPMLGRIVRWFLSHVDRTMAMDDTDAYADKAGNGSYFGVCCQDRQPESRQRSFSIKFNMN